MRLEAEAIVAGYNQNPVLHGVRVAVESGEFVGLIGPNGCGKSTLLRVLTCVLRPRSGAVWLDGQQIERWSALERARRLAFVPQQEPAQFDFTVRDVVLMGRYPYRARFRSETREDYAIVGRALAEADLVHLADRSILHLSGGEYRRVLLARALAQQTPLLVLDEPTAHLDVTHQAELLHLTRRLTREKQVGALAALHDLNQAAEFCDRLVLLKSGRVIADGAPEQVLTVEHLRQVYDAAAQVGRNPATGRPMVLTLHSVRETRADSLPSPVHVLCGGGAGLHMLGALVRQGFRVTAGVLNRLDSDQEAAEALGIPTVLEAPFSPISADARAQCAVLMAQAQMILIAPVPFGHGNLANLELAVEAQQAGKTVVLIGDTDFASRDYTGGTAARLLEQLRAQGAPCFDQWEDWLTTCIAPAAPSETNQTRPAHAETPQPAPL